MAENCHWPIDCWLALIGIGCIDDDDRVDGGTDDNIVTAITIYASIKKKLSLSNKQTNMDDMDADRGLVRLKMNLMKFVKFYKNYSKKKKIK